MGFQNSTAGTGLSEAYLDEEAKQSVLLYATAAARNADAALSAACREGIVSYQADENTLKVQRDTTLANVSTIGPVHGALTAWTPVVTQLGTVTYSGGRAVYMRTGRWCQGQVYLPITGAGTAANVVTVTIPFAAAGLVDVIGAGYITDASGNTRYNCIVDLESTTAARFHIVDAGPTDANQVFGSGLIPTALASGDTVSYVFGYECASDL